MHLDALRTRISLEQHVILSLSKKAQSFEVPWRI